jgi:hypothetical protein
VYDVEQLHGPTCFVSLQVAHQVPARGVTTNVGYFTFGFLHAVLAQISDAGLQRASQERRRMGLADRN